MQIELSCTRSLFRIFCQALNDEVKSCLAHTIVLEHLNKQIAWISVHYLLLYLSFTSSSKRSLSFGQELDSDASESPDINLLVMTFELNQLWSHV